MPGRGRKIALVSLAAGILVAAGAAWAARDGLVESWYVHRLRSSRDAGRRHHALQALGKLNRGTMVPEIVAAGVREEALRPFAVKALADMGPSAEMPLIAALEAADPAVRRLAGGALQNRAREGEEPLPLLLWLLAEGTEDERLRAVKSFRPAERLPAAAIAALGKTLRGRGRVAWFARDTR